MDEDLEEIKRKRKLQSQTWQNESLDSVREISRQEYLRKREEQQLLLLQQKVADEQDLFKDEKLSKRERRELEYKNRLLQVLKQRESLEAEYDGVGYLLPEDYLAEKEKSDRSKRERAMYKRFKDSESYDNSEDILYRGKKITEQELWEQTRLAHSGVSAKSLEDTEEFDFVFDENEHIDFVLDSTLIGEMPATLHDHVKAKALQQSFASQRELQRAKLLETRRSLPMFAYRDEFLKALEEFPVLVVVGETGSGKTTQLPQYLFESGYCKDGKKIGCTQPRRVAAMSVAKRVADEMDCRLGAEVGYAIRFEDCTSDETVVKYMTDGMLLREFMMEPDLASYSAVIIDEAHERTLHTDILLALVKDLARYRNDFRVIISSATMDAHKFSTYFDDAPIFTVPGRRFPVDIYYTKAPEADYLAAVLRTIFQIHLTQSTGDILVFLTGEEEINSCTENLQYVLKQLGSKVRELIICPCYSALPADFQAKIFEPTPSNARKVVLATNVAETSITIDGIAFVIDPGFVKQTFYDARTNMESLQVVPCSKASANQRAGRAGRVGPGKCFRLYTAWSFKRELEDNTQPEIQRTSLSHVVLLLKSLGIDDLLNFDFLDPPPANCLIRALEQLYALGALNAKGDLTHVGHRLSEFPVDPKLAKMIVASEGYGCTREILAIAAMLSVSSMLFYRPKEKSVQADKARLEFYRPGGDHMMLLAIWETWLENGYSTQWCFDHFIQFRSLKRARDVRDQLANLCERIGIIVADEGEEESYERRVSDPVVVRQCVTAGYFYHAARLAKSGDHYKSTKFPQKIYIHPSSSLIKDRPKWLIYHELVLTKKEYMRQVVEINPQWLIKVAPHYFKEEDLAADLQTRMPKGLC